MFTWRLWLALHREPPRHPIFRLKDRPRAQPSPLLTRFLVDVLPLLVLALMVFSAWLLALVFLAGLLLLLLTSGIVYGLVAALGVSHAVSRYRANGRYDLMALTPDGVFGATWAIGAHVLQQTDMLNYLRWVLNRVYLASFFGLIFGLVFAAAMMWDMTRAGDSPFQAYLLPGIANALIALAIHLLDFTRAGLLGTLIGWIAPTYARRRVEIPLLALALYLTAQITTYLALWMIGWQGFALVFSPLTSPVLLNLARLALVFAVREVTLRGLWQVLLRRLNVSPAETQLALANYSGG